MTERGALRTLYAATLVASAILVGVVTVLEAGDEVLMFGAAAILMVSCFAVGEVTSRYAPSRRRERK